MNALSPAPRPVDDAGLVVVPKKLAHYVIRAKRFEEMLVVAAATS